jgi:DNA-binding MarR family transcriptional regulator
LPRQVLTPQASERPTVTAWVRLLRGHAAARRRLDAELQSAHGLTVVGYEALLLLSRADEQAMRRVDLAEGLGLTPSGVTRLLDGLERQGLVAKRTCDADARVTYAVLTEAGRARLEGASCSHVGSVRALFEERYDPEELEALAELLGRLPGAAFGDADAESCTP